MGTTGIANVYSAPVVAQIASERVFTSTPLMRSGYVADARQLAVRGGVSDTISFPYETNTSVTAQTNARDGSAVTPSALATTYEDVIMVHDIVSIRNDSRAMAKMLDSGLDPETRMGIVAANAIEAKCQTALITAAEGTTLTHTEETGITANIKGITKAMIVKWGDKAANRAPLVLLHSYCAWDLQNSDEFAKLGVYGQLPRGEVIGIGGLNYLMCDSINSTDGVYNNLIIMPDALELWFELESPPEPVRTASSTAWTYDFPVDYAAHLARTNPKGVIVYQCVSSLD